MRFNDRFMATIGLSVVAGIALGVLLTNFVRGTETPGRVSADEIPFEEQAGPPPAPPVPQIGVRAVEKVIAGDIVSLMGTGPVRLLGVETRQGPGAKPMDPEVSRALLQQIIGDKPVIAECDPATAEIGFKTDDDLLLVYLVKDDGTYVNDELIARGGAVVSFDQPCSRRDELMKAERDARWQSRGLWNTAPQLAPLPPGVTPSVTVPGRSPAPPMSVGTIGPPQPAIKNGVLVTTDGRFHRSSCSLSKGGIPMSADDARAKHYLACPACFASHKLGG